MPGYESKPILTLSFGTPAYLTREYRHPAARFASVFCYNAFLVLWLPCLTLRFPLPSAARRAISW
jgi:hypothetical protein